MPTIIANTPNALDADLYSSQSQSAETENLSATGNLNIGMIIDYDAMTERRANGGHAAGELQSATSSVAASQAPSFFSQDHPDSLGNITSTAVEAPPAPSIPHDALYAAIQPAAQQPDTASLAGAPSFASLSASSGGGISTPAAGSIPATPAPISNLADYTTNITNNVVNPGDVTNTLTQNVSNVTQTFTDITQVAGDTITNTVNRLTHTVGDILHTTVNGATNVLNTAITNVSNNVDTLVNSVNTTVNHLTDLITTTENTVSNMVNNILQPLLPQGDPIITLDTTLLSHTVTNTLSNNNFLDSDLSILSHTVTHVIADNDVIDLDLGALSHGVVHSISDNDIVDLDVGLVSAMASNATSDNDIIDIDLLALSTGSSHATQDNDLIDVDAGILSQQSSHAAENHDVIGVGLDLLTPDAEGETISTAALSLQADSSTLPGDHAVEADSPALSLDISLPSIHTEDTAAQPVILAAMHAPDASHHAIQTTVFAMESLGNDSSPALSGGGTAGHGTLLEMAQMEPSTHHGASSSLEHAPASAAPLPPPMLMPSPILLPDHL